jgi:hypothetical protein
MITKRGHLAEDGEMKLGLRIVAVLGLMVSAAPAWPSTDSGYCDLSMQVFYSGFSNCDSMALLSPANDTRINLTLLLADARRQKLKQFSPDHTGDYPGLRFTPTNWTRFSAALDFGQKPVNLAAGGSYVGEGTVCVSMENGTSAFVAAVTADAGVPESEKAALTQRRKALSCEPAAAAFAPFVLQSVSGKEFAAYLAAIEQFYHSNHANGVGFAALAQSSQMWVREAAHYMLARTALLDAQSTAFDEYGTLQKEGVLPSKVTTALALLNAYLKEFPKGAYASSATGLLRRACWLSNDSAKQIAAYAQTMAAHDVDPSSLDVISELDQKIPPSAYQNPAADMLFLATEDFRLMRPKMDDNDKPLPGIKAAEVEAQHSRFAGNEKLYSYLLAARAWFADKDAKTVLQLLPPEVTGTGALSYLDYSSQMLRAGALALSDVQAARAIYVAIIARGTQAYQRGAAELAIALLDERSKNISAVFAPDSLITEPALRQRVLDYVAGPILLRQQAQAQNVNKDERDVALYRLLARDLLQGRFKGFGEDIKLLPPVPAANADGTVMDPFEPFRWAGDGGDFQCRSIADTAKLLADDPHSVSGRLCLGDFMRLKSVTNPEKAEPDALGGTGTLFAGVPIARQDFYTDIMRDAKASHEQRGYALFRAIHCYEPIGNNDCGGNEVPKAQRKKWYGELKAKYSDLGYTKELHYYW